MANYLTIDIGNTTSKAMAWINDRPAGEPIWGQLRPADIEHLCACVNGRFDCAAVCCVSNDAYGLALTAKSLADRYISLSVDTPLPLSISRYSTASTLGPDRIAAMAGAMYMHPGQDALVVDCGTAVTYDFITANGEFMGGNIAPGLGMRLKALHAFTARLPQVESDPRVQLWGHSTAQAMQAGALYGVVAETAYYHGKCPQGTALVLTGGRSRDISRLLNTTPHTCDTLLVLKGLKYIIDYNENK